MIYFQKNMVIGQKAIKEVENYFPNTKIWKLVTPTEIVRSAVFYINKCGYHIVSVDYEKQREQGMKFSLGKHKLLVKLMSSTIIFSRRKYQLFCA